jgi:hypothetical protein
MFNNKAITVKMMNEADAMNVQFEIDRVNNAFVACITSQQVVSDETVTGTSLVVSQSVADEQDDNSGSDETVSLESYVRALQTAVYDRAVYENEKNPENATMYAKLKSFAREVSNVRLASVMRASNVDANLLNRQERVNARFNEKSYVKVLNIARAIDGAESLNVYTRAILASVKCFEDNGMQITQSETKLACSAGTRASATVRNSALIRTSRIYDPSTMSTQASSTNNALQAYDVIREVRNANGELCFALNRDCPATVALLARL